jgi:hypothetical protein
MPMIARTKNRRLRNVFITNLSVTPVRNCAGCSELTRSCSSQIVGTSQLANRQPMEQEQQLLQTMMATADKWISMYMAILAMGTAAVSFAFVCAGIWLLRNSGQNEARRNELREKLLYRQLRPEPSGSTAGGKPQEEKQQSRGEEPGSEQKPKSTRERYYGDGPQYQPK